MESINIHTIIKNSLPNSHWSEVIAALKQDAAVWRHLQNRNVADVLRTSNLNQLEDWLPANLGIVSLNLPVSVEDLHSSNTSLLDDELFSRALNMLEEVRAGEDIHDLEEALIVALAIREKHCLGNSWQSMRKDLSNCRMSSLFSITSCLFGIVNNPIEFLGDFAYGKRQSAHYQLILHTLLSNPIGIDLQADILLELITNDWYSFAPQFLDHVNAINYLSLARPELARELSQKLLDRNIDQMKISIFNNFGLTNDLSILENQILYTTLINSVDGKNLNKIEKSRTYETILDLMVDIITDNSHVSRDHNSIGNENGDIKYQLIPEIFSKEALENHPNYKKYLLTQYVKNQDQDQLKTILEQSPNEITSDFIVHLSQAQASFKENNTIEATHKAREAIASQSPDDADILDLLLHHQEQIIYDFITLLFDIDLNKEALMFSKRVLVHSPGDVNLYLILGEALISDFSPNEALKWFYEATLLKPDNLEIRRKLASCLEKTCNWADAYDERKSILEEAQNKNQLSEISDFHLLAECALNMGYLEETLELCERATDFGGEHGFTHTIIGKTLYKEGNYEAALEQFEKGIELLPNSPSTWLALGDAQIQAGDMTSAKDTLNTAIQAIPYSADIYLALGDLQLSQKAYTEALTTFKQGSEIEPLNILLILKLGTTLHLLMHLDQARDVLEAAHRRKPNHVEIAHEYAMVLLELGEERTAIPVLEIVLQSNPKDVEPYLDYAEAVLTTGIASQKNKSYDEIIDVLHQVIDLEPENPYAYALLGEFYALKKDFLEAKQAYQIALDSNLVEDEGWFARLSMGMGKVALALGQEDVALASLQEAVHADPDNPLIYRALSEVYQAADLAENALQASRAALNLAVDDIETLSWYADQMMLIYESEKQKSTDFSNELINKVQIEALNALHQAIQIAPDNPSLFVKLGKMQINIGEESNAIKSLYLLIDNEYAGAEELITAGRLLAELGDYCAAITCLEHVRGLFQDTSNPQFPTLSIELAKLYQAEGDYESALESLNRAQKFEPSSVPVYSTKATVLLELNREEEALDCLKEGLDITPEDENQIILHLLAGNIFRIKGELRKSLAHGQKGISLCPSGNLVSDQNIAAIRDIILLTTELYRAILKPNRGRLLLKEMERKYKIDFTQDVDYCCTYLELFLDTIDADRLTGQISRLVEQNPDHPRILALQSRIFKRRSDVQTALQILHSALDSANQRLWKSKANQHYLQIPSFPIQYSLIDAALELNQWEAAQYLIGKLQESIPQEPRALLNQTKNLVIRAEYQRLCEDINIVSHAPGPIALSPETKSEFEEAISATIKNLPPSESTTVGAEDRSEVSKINPILNRWHARGLVVFGNEKELENGIIMLTVDPGQNNGNKSHLNPDDIAALIAAEVRLGNINEKTHVTKLIQTTNTYPAEANLNIQAAIALSNIEPVQAKKLLDQVNDQIRSKESPDRAIVNAFSAQIAMQLDQFDDAKARIDTAIRIWPNEPKWQMSAAEIYKALGNIPEAIHHFDKAIQIEPHNIDSHLKLGKLLIEYSGLDPNYSKRAVQILESGCRLRPNEPEPWIYLTRAYLLIMDLEQAVSCADMAVTLAPDRIEPLVLRSEVALHQEDPTCALDYAQRALSMNNNDLQSILIQSQALRDLNQPKEALNILEAAMKAMEDPIKLQVEYAILLNDVRGPQASIDALKTLAEKHPDDPIILGLLAKNLAEVEDTEGAIQTAQRALQVSDVILNSTEKAELHYLLGKLLAHVRQLDQAVYHLSESISLVPNYVDPYIELGHTHQARRQYRQALDAYQKATQIAPNDHRPHYHAGIALKEGKDYQSAESMLRRAADLAPDDVNIRRQLAAVVALNLVHNPRSQRIIEEETRI